MQFIGRGNTVADAPCNERIAAALSGSQGSVLDPIVAIRYRITLDPEESATIDMVSGIGETRDVALSLVEKYQDRRLADRVFELAWTHSQVVLRQINATEADAQLYGRLASSVIYANSSLRADAAVLIKNRRGQSGLWGYAISGDLPIVLLQIGDPANIDLVRQLVQAHAYWRLKGLAVDLVIWNEDHAGYRQLLQEQIMGLIAAGVEAHVMDRPGGIFVRPAEQISDEDRILLQSVARAIVSDSRGTLAEQINRRASGGSTRRALDAHSNPAAPRLLQLPRRPRSDLLLLQRAWRIHSGRARVRHPTTHQPGDAGAVGQCAGESALRNRHLRERPGLYLERECSRIPPYSLAQRSGERCQRRGLLPPRRRDADTSGLPRRFPAAGRPLTSAATDSATASSSIPRAVSARSCGFTWPWMPPVKFTVLKVRNESGRSRRLSVTGYVEWVLGDLRPKSAMHVITEIDANSGALFARNPYNTEFADRMAFFDVDDATRTMSGDRTEFLGRNGTLGNPAAMTRSRLSGKVGAALDPCAAIQVPFELAQDRSARSDLHARRRADID